MGEKYNGTFLELKDKVESSGYSGNWSELLNGHKQFKANNGLILNWWETTKTITLQGNKEEADNFKSKIQQHSTSTISKTQNDNPKIFIVHGHDLGSLDQLELILRRLGLDPYILQNNDGKCLTIIEALEQQIYEKSTFGIILMTPDDYGYKKEQSDADRQPGSRQNVILEMGMVMASLGRNRMVILKKGNLELPSDVNGLIYLEFNDHVKEIATKLVQRIKSVGIIIDDTKIPDAIT